MCNGRTTRHCGSLQFLHSQAMQKEGLSEAEAYTNDLRIQWWTQYEIAARKIQRCFRCWNTSRYFRRNYSRKLKLEEKVTHTFPSLEESFRNVIYEDSCFADKMCIWRGAIELRRAHKVHNTDLIIRSLIDSKGDLARAIVLLGTKDYAILNKADISLKLRRIFLPKLETINHHTSDGISNSRSNSNNQYRDLLLSSLRKTLPIDNNGEIINSKTETYFQHNNVNVIRSLRNMKKNEKQIIYEKSREDKRIELLNILNSTIEKAYFSHNHIGYKEYKIKQKQPNTATITTISKEYLYKQNELLLSSSMEYLTGGRNYMKTSNL